MPATFRLPQGGRPPSQAPSGSRGGEHSSSIPPRPQARRCPDCEQIFSSEARFCPYDGDRLVDAPEWNPEADPLIGITVDNRYKVMSVLGEGATGKLYKVQHVALSRLFALKVLRRDVARDAAMVERFLREAQAAAAIGHPNIISVSDFGNISIDGPGKAELPYFVMEYLPGASLATLIRKEKTLSPARAGPLFLQAASALAAAHAAGVIHRDLKPANIFVSKSGDREFVKLLDFGVAKIEGTGRLTKEGMVTGTPDYMCPERVRGLKIDHRADIYSLGAIMYQCFAGRAPFEAEIYAEVLKKHVSEAPQPVEQAVKDPKALGAFGPIVMRCLAKDPNDRFETASELAAAIEVALAPFQVAGAKRRSVQKAKAGGSSSMRGLVGGALGAILVLALAALGAWLLQKVLGSAPPVTPKPIPPPTALAAPVLPSITPASAAGVEATPAGAGTTVAASSRPSAITPPGSPKAPAPSEKKSPPAPTELVNPWGGRDGK
ncbi:MAG TPA: protein kinase [Polyangiaceae bacterium]|nr:protein kinase [Polyangiaceae bacterium]